VSCCPVEALRWENLQIKESYKMLKGYLAYQFILNWKRANYLSDNSCINYKTIEGKIKVK
jgi:hypothetical protein